MNRISSTTGIRRFTTALLLAAGAGLVALPIWHQGKSVFAQAPRRASRRAVPARSVSPPVATPETVAPTVETQPVSGLGDAADDPSIWINPNDPSRSTIIGTDKKGGLAVYDLAGKQIQFLPDGLMNNVDIRSGFPLGGEQVALVTSSNRTDNTIGIYRVNPVSRQLENVAARRIRTLVAYGCCMYRSAKTGKFYYFVNSKTGHVQQWELFDNRKGKVDGKLVRTFGVRTQTEGCVADDELGHFYLGEEMAGIWKFGAEPTAGPTRRRIDRTGPGGHLTADLEGLTIANGRNGTGYLIASSQGSNTYVVYRREGRNEYIKTFRIGAGNGIDGTEETDGIDVTTVGLGPGFPAGVFVAQDGINDGGNQNFKLVPLQSIFPDLNQASK